MFKKSYSVSRSSALSGKDAKQFRSQLVRLYPGLDGEPMNVLFPPKASMFMSKLTCKAVVYGLEGGDPLFFDPTGFKDKLLPTVSAHQFCVGRCMRSRDD